MAIPHKLRLFSCFVNGGGIQRASLKAEINTDRTQHATALIVLYLS
jgi:hypothetical protein